jgi:hypothetical protein
MSCPCLKERVGKTPYAGKTAMCKPIIKNEGFLRYQVSKHWTIGYNLRNRVLLQFTKTVPYTGQPYRLFSIPMFYYCSTTRTVAKAEQRTWIEFGWFYKKIDK